MRFVTNARALGQLEGLGQVGDVSRWAVGMEHPVPTVPNTRQSINAIKSRQTVPSLRQRERGEGGERRRSGGGEGRMSKGERE